MYRSLLEVDPDIAEAVRNERERLCYTLEMIASENFVSEAVLEALGSELTNKYAEGYPGKRYYAGCEFVDVVENLAKERARQLFDCEHVNVQPHSGSQANMAVYLAVLKYGETILGMNLSHGGHLTHGHPLNFSGRSYNIVPYGVNVETEELDYDEMERLAHEHKPKLIICGASAYSRIIDFKRIGRIARDVGAWSMADIAHIAGLVAAGLHPSPIPHMDFVTTTTHKTLRGPRAGMIMCRKQYANEIDRAVFPTVQGGPLMQVIAAKAVCFKEASEESFKAYQRQVISNAQALAGGLSEAGFRVVSGGTDNHLMLVDVLVRGLTGSQGERALEGAGITVNKNAIPFDTLPPMKASGIRIGTPAVTTRGMKEPEMMLIAKWIDKILAQPDNESLQKDIRGRVRDLCMSFPIYENRALRSSGSPEGILVGV
ncbi:MAG TPA: serine hydroxymethyltransferase [Blastocatellia bacterium]|nr:serine hydroxymethyltransferase [Blastocatellia bacterium]